MKMMTMIEISETTISLAVMDEFKDGVCPIEYSILHTSNKRKL